MAKYSNACPPELLEDEDGVNGYYFEPQKKKEQSAAAPVKILDAVGVRAGVNKANFDISLDSNAQQWFDRIYQYWKQCKSFSDSSNFSSHI